MALKRAKGIKSLTKLDNASLSAHIDEITRFFAIEYGIYLRMPGEPENVASLSLSEYLATMKEKEQIKIFQNLEQSYDLNSHRERRRFLCDLIEMPYTSSIGDDQKLLDGIKDWLGNY